MTCVAASSLPLHGAAGAQSSQTASPKRQIKRKVPNYCPVDAVPSKKDPAVQVEVEEGKVQNIVQEFSRQAPAASTLPPKPTSSCVPNNTPVMTAIKDMSTHRPVSPITTTTTTRDFSDRNSVISLHQLTSKTNLVLKPVRSPRYLENDKAGEIQHHQQQLRPRQQSVVCLTSKSPLKLRHDAPLEADVNTACSFDGAPLSPDIVQQDHNSMHSGCDSSIHSSRLSTTDRGLSPGVADHAAATAKSMYSRSKSFFESQAAQSDNDIALRISEERRLLDLSCQRQYQDIKHLQALKKQHTELGKENDTLYKELKEYREKVHNVEASKQKEITGLQQIVSKLEMRINGEMRDIKEQHASKVKQVSTGLEDIVLKNRALVEQLRWFRVTPVTEVPNELNQFSFWSNLDERRKQIETQSTMIQDTYVDRLHTLDLNLQKIQETTCHLARVISKVPVRIRVSDPDSDHITRDITVESLNSYWAQIAYNEQAEDAIRERYRNLHEQKKNADEKHRDSLKLASQAESSNACSTVDNNLTLDQFATQAVPAKNIVSVEPDTPTLPVKTPQTNVNTNTANTGQLPGVSKPINEILTNTATIQVLSNDNLLCNSEPVLYPTDTTSISSRSVPSQSKELEITTTILDATIPHALSEVGRTPTVKAIEQPSMEAIGVLSNSYNNTMIDMKLDFGGDSLLDGLLDFL